MNSASGRAVMHWFGADERGLALGVRQTAVPLGGLVAALVVPQLTSSGDARERIPLLRGAVRGGRRRRRGFHPRGERARGRARGRPRSHATLRDGRLWRLALGSGVYVYAQIAIIGFGVVFLHDEHGLSERDAALVIAASQVLAVGIRIGDGPLVRRRRVADRAAPPRRGASWR